MDKGVSESEETQTIAESRTVRGAKGRVLIVGGGSGLGLSLVERFCDEGWETTVVSRSAEKWNHSELELYLMPKNEIEVDELVAEYLDRPWSLVIVVSGGGFGKTALFESFNEVANLSWINFGLHYCFLKALYKAGVATTVVVFGSIAAREAVASPAYTLAKKQLEAMIRIYGKKLVGADLSLIGISIGGLFCPGNAMDRLRIRDQRIFDDFIADRLPRKKFLLPDDVFGFLTFLLRSDPSVWSGSVLCMDGGESTHL